MKKENVQDAFDSLSKQFYGYAKEYRQEAQEAYEQDHSYENAFYEGKADAYSEVASYISTVGDAICK